MTLPEKTCRPGQTVEVGRYELQEEARQLLGRRIDGVVHIYDRPRDGRGRTYFVDAGFGSCRELAVFLADYRSQAKRLGGCPMSREAIDTLFRVH